MTHLTSRTTRRRRRTILSTATTGLVAATATLAFAGPANAATNVVADSDFAAGSAGTSYVTYCVTPTTNCPAANPTFGSWTVTSGSVDLYSNGFLAPPAGDPATTQSVDLDGSEPGGIQQLVSLPASTYLVSFQVGQNIPGCHDADLKKVTYGVGPNPAGTFTYDPASTKGWVPVSFPLAIGTSANYPIFFRSADPAGAVCGPVITDVSITDISGGGATPITNWQVGVPTAGALGLLATGVLWLRRRRVTG